MGSRTLGALSGADSGATRPRVKEQPWCLEMPEAGGGRKDPSLEPRVGGVREGGSAHTSSQALASRL